VVAAEDPARAFLAASPERGDHHNWLVWHGFLPPSAYRHDDARFASEFGLQSPPSTESWRSFLPPNGQWPPGDAWELHGAGLQKLWRYARPYFPTPLRHRLRPGWSEISPESFVHASQTAHLQGLKIAIEHFRRRKAAGCGGVLVWQLNEPWPAISWALIPFSGEPKLAYRALQGLFNPLMVSLAYPLRRFSAGDQLTAQVWAINDSATALPCCELRVALYDDSGRPLERASLPVDVAACSAEVVSRVSWRLPPGDRWLVTCALTRNGHVLSANQYDLALFDSIQPTAMQRLWTWLTGLVSRL
jgi:beta-mannosidase